MIAWTPLVRRGSLGSFSEESDDGHSVVRFVLASG